MLRRTIAYGLVAIIIGAILAALGGWMLATSEPAGYTRATDFTPEQLGDQASKFIKAATEVYNCAQDSSGGTPLDITLTDTAINGYIRSLPPQQLKQLPSWFSNPQVVFRDGEVVLMGDVYFKGHKAVGSMHVAPRVTEDGDLQLEMRTTRAGRLPLPDMVSKDTIDHLDRKLAEMKARDEPDDDREARVAEMKLMALTGLCGLLKGEAVTLETRRYKLKLDALEVLDGRVHVVGRHIEKPAGQDAGRLSP